MLDHPCLLRYEELTLNTAPALFEAHIDGWVVRASGTDTMRSNAATCLTRGSTAFDSSYERICDWYARHQQAPAFRLSPLADPSVAPFLLARGFVAKDEAQFMVAEIGRVESAASVEFAAEIPAGTRLVERTVADCMNEIHRIKQIIEPAAGLELERQARWRGAERAVALRSINGTLSFGLARIEAQHAGIFNLRTAPRQEGKGYARLVMQDLLRWASEQGARHAFLQVEVSNSRAIALYERAGFRTAYVYSTMLKANLSTAQC